MILRNGKNTLQEGCGLTIFKWYIMHCKQFSHIFYETPDERMYPFCDPYAGDFYQFEIPPPEEFNKFRHIYVRTAADRFIFRQPISGEATFLCHANTYESVIPHQYLDDNNKKNLDLPLNPYDFKYTGSRYSHTPQNKQSIVVNVTPPLNGTTYAHIK